MTTPTGWYLNELVPYLREHLPGNYGYHMAANAIVDLVKERDDLLALLALTESQRCRP